LDGVGGLASAGLVVTGASAREGSCGEKLEKSMLHASVDRAVQKN
jgi:hypothetical protein